MLITSPPSRRMATQQAYARYAGVGVLLVGVLVMIGWLFGVAPLKSIVPGLATMKFNTALGFALDGGAILLLNSGRQRGAQLCAVVVALLGLTTLAEYILGTNIGLDQWFVRDTGSTAQYPGRMSPATALGLSLLGSSLVLLARRRWMLLAQAMAVTAGFLALLAIIGYLYGVESLYRISTFASVALHTALALLALSFSVLSLYPDQGVMAAFTSDSAGGLLARRLLPAAVLLPPLLGWARLLGQRAGLYGTEFGLSLFALSNVVVFSVLVMWTARSLHRVDREREDAVDALQHANEGPEQRVEARTAELAAERNLLRAVIDNIPDHIYIKDMDSRLILANPETARYLGASSADEIIGKNDFDLFPPEEAKRYFDDEQALLHSRQPLLNFESSSLDRDGKARWLLITKVPFFDGQGKPLGLVGINRDITERKQIEATLRQSEARFRAMNESSPLGIFLTNPNGECIYTNLMYQQITSLSFEEALGNGWNTAIYKEDRDRVFNEWYQAAEQQTLYESVHRYARKDGSLVGVSVKAAAVRDGEMLLGYVGTVEDITRRREAEAELAAERNILRTLIDTIPDAIYVKDAQGRFIIANTRQAQLSGVSSPEDLISKTDLDIFPQHGAAYYADEQALLRSGQPLLDKEEPIGERIGESRWHLTSKVPLRNTEGNIVGLVGVGRDITERREFEEALRVSEARLRTVTSSVPIILFVLDREGRYTLSVGQGLEALELQSGERIGQSLYEVYAHRPDVIEHFHRALNGEARVYEMTYGPDSVFEIRLAPLPAPDGQVTAVIGVAIDVTERKRAEEERIELELQRAQVDVLKRFIGDASHDLRTPLTIMNSSLYLLRKSNDPERQKRHLDNLDEQVAHIQKLVEDLFILSQLDMPASEFNFQPDDLNQLVNDLYQEQIPLAARKQHRMTLTLGDDLPRVPLAQAEFRVALRHLVMNAIHYTPDGGEINVKTYLKDGQAVFEVRDNGIGIGADDLPRIFERFYRADKARNTETGGSGLGLTIAKKIVEVHGGRIEVESAPGVGSVFRVTLPLIN